jgi:hypothetical protein
MIFSAKPLRAQRLCGELSRKLVHRRDAEGAENGQRTAK